MCRRFDPGPHHKKSLLDDLQHRSEHYLILVLLKKTAIGAVAQLVEQWTENPCVAGSIPAHTTE